MTEYFHIKTNGDVSLGLFDGLEPKQEAVGGLIQQVHLHDGRHMWANEEGLLQRLPLNPIASRVAGMPIVGDVLLVNDKNKVSYAQVISQSAARVLADQKTDKVTE